MKKKILISISLLVFFVIAIWFICAECIFNPNFYSEEKHLNNVLKLAEKKYGGSRKYEIYPLYNNEDKIAGFLLNFNEVDYTIIKVENPHFLQKLFGSASMYPIGSHYDFQRYKIRDNVEQITENGIVWKISSDFSKAKEYPNRLWETDINGEEIIYKESFYQVAKVMNEKKYLLQIVQENNIFYIPAIKCGEKYLNLISMEEFEYKQFYETEEQSCIELVFYVGNNFK